MAGEWKETRLGDHVTLKGGLSYKGEFVDKGDAMLIGMGCVSHTERFLRKGGRRYGGDFSEAHLVRPGDLVIATRQQSDNLPILGFPAMIPEDLRGRDVIAATNLYKVTNHSEISNRFLYWLMRGTAYRERILGCAKGTTVRMLTKDAIEDFYFLCPPKEEREAIAQALDALDDKIELNRRMNATLEAMARALFQSWFVDFDPVRAKLDARQPTGLDPATAALFPDHLEDSPLGHIPKGWKAGTVNDAFNFTMGQSPPGDTYNQEGNGIPFYQGCTDFGFRFPTRRVFCTAPTRYAKAGDTLVSVRAPVGDINMANEDCCIGRGVAAVRHKTGAKSFTYHAMANLEPDFARFEAEGTVFGSINKQNFENLRFVIPPPEIVAAYERQAAPLDEQIYIPESRTLATLRDTLLPKLLSGVLSVADFKLEGGAS